MTKFRLYLDKDKETAWINEMAAQGYALTGFYAGFYKFEECEPGKYTYQIDFGDKMFSVDNNYREFMAENNIEIVCLWGYWIILRKLTADGEFELYTDVDSSIEHYTKILKMFKVVTIIELICFFVEVLGAMHGAGIGFFGMLLIGAIVIGCMRATISTKRKIAELKERKGEVVTGLAAGKTSPILTSGLLLSACALALKNSSTISDPIITGVQIVAIILMLVGIYQSRNVFKNQ